MAGFGVRGGCPPLGANTPIPYRGGFFPHQAPIASQHLAQPDHGARADAAARSRRAAVASRTARATLVAARSRGADRSRVTAPAPRSAMLGGPVVPAADSSGEEKE